MPEAIRKARSWRPASDAGTSGAPLLDHTSRGMLPFPSFRPHPMRRAMLNPWFLGCILGLCSIILACQESNNGEDKHNGIEPTDPAVLDRGGVFGVFAPFTPEYAPFMTAMDLGFPEYQQWAGAGMRELGATWTRSNLQLVWKFVEPELGGSFDWEGSFGGEMVFSAAARHAVNYLAVFHHGDHGGDRDPLLNPDGWLRFVRAAVERYSGGGVNAHPSIVIRDWQMGNEIPEWTGSFGDTGDTPGRTADEYVAWFEMTAEAIREIDPDSRVALIASLSGKVLDPFHKEVISKLADRRIRFDAVDLHHWGTASVESGMMDGVVLYRSLLDSKDLPNVEIWSLEHGTYVGSPTGKVLDCESDCQEGQVCTPMGCRPPCRTDEDCRPTMPYCHQETGLCSYPKQTEVDQARSLVYRFVANRDLGVSKILWNSLVGWRCFKGNCGSFFDLCGLVNDGFGEGETQVDVGRRRLSFRSFSELAMRTDTHVARPSGRLQTEDGVYAYEYQHKHGGRALVAWSKEERTATLPWSSEVAWVTSLITDSDGHAPTSSVEALGSLIEINLGPDPQWISSIESW